MSGTVYGQHFSVRIPDVEAEQFDALARAAGMKRSELLRMVILRLVAQERPEYFVVTGADLTRARTIGAPS